MDKGDERNATLTLKLRAKSGYSCDATYQVSANDWGAVCKLLEARQCNAEGTSDD